MHSSMWNIIESFAKAEELKLENLVVRIGDDNKVSVLNRNHEGTAVLSIYGLAPKEGISDVKLYHMVREVHTKLTDGQAAFILLS